jgi:hypothetical protein
VGLDVLIRTPLGSQTQTSCRDLVVLVNQAAEAIPAPNLTATLAPARRHPDVDTPRRIALLS